MPYVTVGEENSGAIDLYYEDHGSGRPVVLIHGWPLSGRSWEKQMPALVEDGYRVITYDRRGFGASSQPWDGYDYDTLAADLHKLLEHLDLTAVSLVGFSMGGGEVARYVRTYGTERLAKVVFAAAVPPYLYRSADNPEGALDDAAVAGFRDGLNRDRIAYIDGFITNFFAVGDRSDLVSEPQRRYQVAGAVIASPRGTVECTEAFSKTDFRDDLEAVDVTTLVIHGDHDAIVPFEVSGRRTGEAIPDSKVVVVKDAPHGLNFTHAETFNAELLVFLRE
jgi:pimeloyl-ACP methyl ester carboxylesterase